MKTFTLVTAAECCDTDDTIIVYGNNIEAVIEEYLNNVCCTKIRVLAAFEGVAIDILTEIVEKGKEKCLNYSGGAL